MLRFWFSKYLNVVFIFFEMMGKLVFKFFLATNLRRDSYQAVFLDHEEHEGLEG